MDKASRETVPEGNILSPTLLTPGSSPQAKKKMIVFACVYKQPFSLRITVMNGKYFDEESNNFSIVNNFKTSKTKKCNI